MLSRLEEAGFLYQADAVQEIAEEFGDEYTHLNDNGNPALVVIADRQRRADIQTQIRSVWARRVAAM